MLSASDADLRGAVARALDEQGVAHIRGVIPHDMLEAIRTEAASSFARTLRTLLLRQVMSSGGATGAPTRYAEVVERDGGRFDCRMPIGAPPWSTLLGGDAAAAGRLVDPLCHVLGADAEVVAVGQVVAMSLEGWMEHASASADAAGEEESVVLADSLGAQAWHADGPPLMEGLPAGVHLPPHALTVFFPMVDLTDEVGPTEFAPGSHRIGREHTGEGEGDGEGEGEGEGDGDGDGDGDGGSERGGGKGGKGGGGAVVLDDAQMEDLASRIAAKLHEAAVRARARRR